MPQLDKLSFITQIFWLSLFFFSLYFLSINFFTTIIYKNLKLYAILDKNCRNLTPISIINNSFNIYIFYTSLIRSFFIKTSKSYTPVEYCKSSNLVIPNTNFIFEDLQDLLYFHDILNISIIDKENHEI